MSDLDKNSAQDPDQNPDQDPAQDPVQDLVQAGTGSAPAEPLPASAPAPAPAPAATVVPDPALPPADPFRAPDFASPATEFAAPTAPRRGSALRVVAAMAAAVLVGAGIGAVIIAASPDHATAAAPAPGSASVSASPAPAPAPTSTGPAYGAGSNGVHFGSMRDLLLPVPTAFRLGPDDGVYGDDTALTKDQLSSYLDAQVKDLPKDQRDKVKAELQAEGHRGAGVRSYQSDEGTMVATIWLDQFDQQSVKAENAFDGALAADLGVFRDGPQVPDHPDARCFLPQLDPSAPIDGMECTAAVGDLLVTMHVEGVAPLPLSEAVSIFRQQLQRLALPGASV
ncbi:hypothetical protein OG455_20495 [Kitasatospora sp. NBC_01287]|uniref:hypothetical protein n=1 Tax=Kitasatospora sp. NBC_01287 TaxID=2903573 RepID=UPI00225947CE|nr:hypothetical protein [Kitasatospora sp. NBC_01287]MCX4747867.1 hypothetical protein [Kitasatospora sp. NBC_01287]